MKHWKAYTALALIIACCWGGCSMWSSWRTNVNTEEAGLEAPPDIKDRIGGVAGVYSYGFRAGGFFKMSEKETDLFGFGTVGSGELILGPEGTGPVYFTKNIRDDEGNVTDTRTTIANKWVFNTKKAYIAEFQEMLNRRVFIQYAQSNVQAPLELSDYWALTVEPMLTHISRPSFTSKKAAGGGKSIGIRHGTFVKASYKGVAVKTHEVILLVGFPAYEALPISVSDPDMYLYIVDCLKCGAPVEVDYGENHTFKGVYETLYDVHSVAVDIPRAQSLGITVAGVEPTAEKDE